ncbi:MAG: RdgB/HAM1 family non-canonical purine NTP pyrophosphatase [Actinomycetota bacterium]|nr:RdgB/HAM1 family non-canonical purine NTP pyrophosphatase [Actinomycetota bacterium]
MIPRLVVASKNPDKIREIEEVLVPLGLVGEIVKGLDWPDVDETGDTLEANASLKARAVCEATGLPVIADDTGLEVAALDGGPGVHTARFAGPDASYEDNVAHILSEMEGVSDRRARFRTVVALLFPDGVEVLAEGSVEGEITRERRGSGGFGYDPIFEVGDRTLAEMSAEEKNELSHRARAIQALAKAVGL